MRLTERVIWKALENSGLPYRGWTAYKELGEIPRLHLYVELDDRYEATEEEVASAVYEEFQKIDDGLYVYKDLPVLTKLIGFKPVRVTILPTGAFGRYKVQRQSESASLVHLRPPHINPSSEALAYLGVQSDALGEAELTANN